MRGVAWRAVHVAPPSQGQARAPYGLASFTLRHWLLRRLTCLLLPQSPPALLAETWSIQPLLPWAAHHLVSRLALLLRGVCTHASTHALQRSRPKRESPSRAGAAVGPKIEPTIVHVPTMTTRIYRILRDMQRYIYSLVLSYRKWLPSIQRKTIPLVPLTSSVGVYEG